jgi:hypothetical protein
MRKLIIFSVFILFADSQLNAQTKQVPRPSYKSAIGLRPFPFGLDFKANLDTRRAALEFVAYFKEGFAVLGLYEWHFAINEPRNLKFYLGGGGVVGFKNESNGGGAVLGIAGVIGLDYKFLKLPLNLCLDWQPSYQIGKVDELKNFGGLAVRYTL